MKQTAAPWIEGFARFGYIAVGVVYVIVGLLSAAAGVHGRSRGADKNDAFNFVLSIPFGTALLFAITAGLLGYAAWRFISAIKDAENRGNEPKGLALRAGSIARGIFYSGIAIEVARYATRGGSNQDSDTNAQHWTARLLQQPYGPWLVGIAGLVIIGAGIYQLTKAFRAELSSQLMRRELSPSVIAISRFGIGARGVVFVAVGVSIVRAAIRHNPHAARGTSGAVQQFPYSALLLMVIGVGLAAYGVYAFVIARYRRIDAA